MYTTLNKQTSFFVALSLVLVLFSTCKKDDGECNTANVPTIEWQKTIGDNDTTAINSVQQTNEGVDMWAWYKNNSQIRNVNLNCRFQWRFRPMSDLFIVYSDNYVSDDFKEKNRAFVIKFVYWLGI